MSWSIGCQGTIQGVRKEIARQCAVVYTKQYMEADGHEFVPALLDKYLMEIELANNPDFAKGVAVSAAGSGSKGGYNNLSVNISYVA